MHMFSDGDLQLVEQLLHDAVLEAVYWDRPIATFTARFNCLRGNADGSRMDDRIVQFRLSGVQAIAVGYDSVFLETRPSLFEPPRRLTAANLTDWTFRRQEATLGINSADCETALEAARLDWMQGDGASVKDAPCTFCLHFGQWMDFGLPVINVWIVAAGGSFAIESGGMRLDLGEWEQQFVAWWKGWEEHWHAKNEAGDENDEPAPEEYETFIPTGESETVDLSYRPPPEPIFALEPTDAPPELIQVLRAWFEATQDQNAEDALGRWAYARAVDDWWVEGNRACIVVRGIEHEMPSEGCPGGNEESVWAVALRRRRGLWVIDTWEQGWPKHGSAEKLPKNQKPWLRTWASGKLK